MGRAQLLARAGLFEVPDGTGMIPEGDAARLHRQVRLDEPDLAGILTEQAGLATANYILAHRIPKPAQVLLKALPAQASARLLSRAIAKHAWTFAGSGRFRVIDPWTFEIENNPMIRGETSRTCLCSWHAGVFAQLFRVLVSTESACRETRCGAQWPNRVCRFELCPSMTAG